MSQLTQYAKLIEAVSKEQFDTIIQSFIECFWDLDAVVLVDGKGDGGIDFKLFQNKSHLKIPIQVTVEKKPYEKLLKDLPKIQKLSLQNGYSNELYFFSTHSISEVKLNSIVEEARTKFGIALNFIDSKYISSNLLSPKFKRTKAILRKLFSALLNSNEPIFTKVEKLKFDLIIYGNQTTEIKNKILDSFILLEIFNNGQELDVKALETKINKTFNVESESNLCKRELDKLYQQHKIRFIGHGNSKIQLAEDETNRIETILDDLEMKEERLISSTQEILEKFKIADHFKTVITHIYQIFKEIHNKDLYEIASRAEITSEFKSLKAFIDLLESKLGDKQQARVLAKELIKSCEDNDFLQRVSSGELFSKLIREPEFETYVNISQRNVYLDTSIALHLICALYNPKSKSRNLFYKAAVELLNHSSNAKEKVALKISALYLEEIGLHILDSIKVIEYNKYDFFLKLGRSNNVFLNFFEVMQKLGELPDGINSINDFLIGLGFDISEVPTEKVPRYVHEALLKIFSESEIEVIQFEDYSQTSKLVFSEIKKNVEVELLTKKDNRHSEIIKRDTLMCCFLFDTHKHDNVDPIFITWDNIFYEVRKVYHASHPNASFWHLFRPAKFLDHMSLISLSINSSCITHDILSLIENEFGLQKKVAHLKDVFLKILDIKSESGIKLIQAMSKLQAEELFKLKEKARDSEEAIQENTSVEHLISRLFDYYKSKKGKFDLEDLKSCTASEGNLVLLIDYIKKELESFQRTGKWEKSVYQNLDYIVQMDKMNKISRN